MAPFSRQAFPVMYGLLDAFHRGPQKPRVASHPRSGTERPRRKIKKKLQNKKREKIKTELRKISVVRLRMSVFERCNMLEGGEHYSIGRRI